MLKTQSSANRDKHIHQRDKTHSCVKCSEAVLQPTKHKWTLYAHRRLKTNQATETRTTTLAEIKFPQLLHKCFRQWQGIKSILQHQHHKADFCDVASIGLKDLLYVLTQWKIPFPDLPLHFCTLSRSLTAHFHHSFPGTVSFYEHTLLNPPLSTPLYRAMKWLLWVILLFHILPQNSVESICQHIPLYTWSPALPVLMWSGIFNCPHLKPLGLVGAALLIFHCHSFRLALFKCVNLVQPFFHCPHQVSLCRGGKPWLPANQVAGEASRKVNGWLSTAPLQSLGVPRGGSCRLVKHSSTVR